MEVSGPCPRGFLLALCFVVLTEHRLDTRRLQVLKRLPGVVTLPLSTRPLDLIVNAGSASASTVDVDLAEEAHE